MLFQSISSFHFLEPFPALFHQNILSSATLVYPDRILVFSEVLHEALLVALMVMSFWFPMTKSIVVTRGLKWREKISIKYNSKGRIQHILLLNTAQKN